MPGNQEIGFLSAIAAREALASGQLRAEDYVAALIERIERLKGTIRAFESISADAALGAARQADLRRAAQSILPPLHGIPFAVKDLIDVRGEVTTSHSRVPPQSPARSSATVFKRLQDLGAIYLGKLALEEFGTGSQLDDPLPVRTNNPWDPARSPGGSSTGSAVALAAGLVPLALGTDTTGSVRSPAAFCGIVGLKPTRGRVAQAGLRLLAPTLDTIGPMARTASDCTLLLSGLTDRLITPPAGPWHIRPIALGDLEHLVSREVRCSFDAALGDFESLGCGVGDHGSLPLMAMRGAAACIQRYEAFLAHRERLETHGSFYQPQTRLRLEAGSRVSIAEYQSALAAGDGFAAAVDRLLEDDDFLALPVTFAPAARYDDAEGMELAGDVAFRAPFSLTGHPAMVFCTGFTMEGLPLAMQLVGRRGEDERLLALLEAYQQVTPWHERHPALATAGESHG